MSECKAVKLCLRAQLRGLAEGITRDIFLTNPNVRWSDIAVQTSGQNYIVKTKADHKDHCMQELNDCKQLLSEVIPVFKLSSFHAALLSDGHLTVLLRILRIAQSSSLEPLDIRAVSHFVRNQCS